MKHFLELAKYHQAQDTDLLIFIAELGFNNELTPALLEKYDDMLELLHTELEEQGIANNKFDDEHGLCYNEMI